MRKFLHLSFFTFLIVLSFGSCTTEEEGEETQPNNEVGKLSFGSFLNDFVTKEYLFKTNQQGYSIPQCSDEAPLFVYVALKSFNGDDWVWYKNSNEEKIKIEVNPNGSDLDGDGVLDAWFTNESADLELQEGKYRIEYFAVASGDNPVDIIYMAPRVPDDNLTIDQNIQYHNFVENPLPIDVTIRPGVKYYQPVEVLCYEEHFAFAFGYLFFDFNSTRLMYLCTFGNECSEDEKHMPARFKMKVWKDATLEVLLVVAQNERKSYSDGSGTHYYAEALCFPLPVIGENEEYFAKIWLVEGDNESLIREGSFGPDDLIQIYRQEQEHYYYHFREACCEEADNYSLLNDITANEEVCEEEPQDPECNDCDGKISKLTFLFSGENNTSITVEQSKSGNGRIQIFSQVLDNGEIFTVEGQYSKGQQPNSLWTEIYIKEGTHEIIQIHTSCSDEDVVPGYTIGNFKILSGESANGGLLCPASN